MNRKSIRLKGYDYSQEGFYFITICTNYKICIFGEIENNIMILNDAGRMIERWYYELENKFNDIKCHEKIIMPNHFHCIIQISVGADLSVCPDTANGVCPDTTKGISVGADLRVCPDISNGVCPDISNGVYQDKIKGVHTGTPLPSIIQWFKTMTTNDYIKGVRYKDWEAFHKKMWQRNYWEHIIRNEIEYENISNYIIENPIRWHQDKLYKV